MLEPGHYKPLPRIIFRKDILENLWKFQWHHQTLDFYEFWAKTFVCNHVDELFVISLNNGVQGISLSSSHNLESPIIYNLFMFMIKKIYFYLAFFTFILV